MDESSKVPVPKKKRKKKKKLSAMGLAKLKSFRVGQALAKNTYGAHAIGLIKKQPELDIRKGMHVKLLPDTQAALKILCLKRGVSVQEFFEEMAQRAVSDDPSITSVLDELVHVKKKRYYRQLSASDAESVFDAIQYESPFSKND